MRRLEEDEPTVSIKLFTNNMSPEKIEDLRLRDFACKTSFFESAKISRDFLETEVDTWGDDFNEQYTASRAKAVQISVVNDEAERGIALIKYVMQNPRCKTDEKLKQLVLVVDQKRREGKKDKEIAFELDIDVDQIQGIFPDEEDDFDVSY